MPKIYKVGGCVRDKLLGIESNDIDYTYVVNNLQQTVEAGYCEMKNYLITNNFKIFLETPDCYTIRARFPKKHKYSGLVADFVMSRKEIGYYEGTRRPILQLGSLYDDLLRRDFTVNAIAEDDKGNLIDPFKGQEHLKEKILITPQNPMITIMEDPLRILRALRFSITKEMKISSELFKAFQQPELLQKLTDVVSQERIWKEVYKMFKYNTITSLSLLYKVNLEIPGFLDIIFNDSMYLKPSLEKK